MTSTIRSSCATIGAIVAIFAVRLASADSPVPVDLVDRLVQPYLDAEIVNAVSIGIVKGDDTLTRHYGVLSTSSDEKPNDTTIYELGSISKVFTGILLADAVEAGRVKLDQPIGSVMTELRSSNESVGDSIRLRQLSTHSSGLPRIPIDLVQPDMTDPYRDYNRDKLTTFMGRIKPAHKPDEHIEYSNLGAGLLGELLAIKADTSYPQLLEQRISRPLQLKDTTIPLDESQQARLAPPHNADRQSDHNWNFDALAGCGAIRSTTADMVRFIQANLNPPEDQLGRALNLAWKQHRPAQGVNHAMGLGWHLAHDGSTRWHNGQTGGYHTMMFVNRGFGAGVILLCNTATGEVDALAESIIQSMAGMPVKPREFDKDASVSAESVARLAGRYQLVPQVVMTVRPDGDKLFVQLTGQPEFRVFPKSETEWAYRVVEATISFELSDEGKCTSLTLHQNGQNMPAQRIE